MSDACRGAGSSVTSATVRNAAPEPARVHTRSRSGIYKPFIPKDGTVRYGKDGTVRYGNFASTGEPDNWHEALGDKN